MKKLLLYFTVLSLASTLTGCDGSCTMEFKILNQTKSEIVVEKNNSEQVRIGFDEWQLVDRQVATCAPRGSIAYNDDIKMVNATMKISGITMPDVIWTNKYWDLEIQDSQSIYTLIITYELLQMLETEL